MATGNLTITAPYSTGKTASALALTGIKSIKYNMEKEVIEVVDSAGRFIHFDYETVATVTHTISGETATITVST